MVDIREPVRKVALVMIVAHGDSSSDLIAAEPLFLDKVRPYQVPDRLGTVFISMRSLAGEHDHDCVENDLEIEHERHVFEIIKIVHDFLFDILN